MNESQLPLEGDLTATAPGAPPALTNRFLAGVSLALEIHGDQRRGGTEIPYLAHVLVVTGLVIEDGGEEDDAIAAILHDAVEDGGGRPMLDRIRRLFGPRVAEIVEACSDNLEGDPHEPWIERKRRYLEHLSGVTDQGMLRVCLADKVHNARSIVRDYRESGNALWERFTQKTSRDQLWYYGGLLEFFVHHRPGPLTEDLTRAVAELAWLVAENEAESSPRVRLWLDPDLYRGQAPEGWIQLRTPDEAIAMLDRFDVDSLSLDDGPDAPRVIVWLLEQEETGAASHWPSGEVSFHGRPAPSSVSQLTAATELRTQRRGPRPDPPPDARPDPSDER